MRLSQTDRRTVLLAGIAGLVGAAIPFEVTSGKGYDDPDDLYAALKQPGAIQIPVGDSAMRVAFADGGAGLSRPLVLSWIRTSVTALTGYFGRFPVTDYGLLVIAEDSDTVG
ncbi:MAG: hypothetical protein ACKVOL_07710, partial [Novosphingobium sp.]